MSPRAPERRWIPSPGQGLLLALALVLAVSAGGEGFRRQLFAWTDAEGVTRYTANPERVPRADRDSIREIESGLTARQNADLLPGARVDPEAAPGAVEWLAEELPPDEVGGDPFNAPEEAVRLRSDESLRAARLSALDEQIRELELAILRDEEAVKALISDPEGAAQLGRSQELRTISQRLPERQAQLVVLRDERDQLVGRVP